MSWWLYTIAFLFALPVAVWFLANIAAVIDEPDKTKPLVRLALAVSVLLVFFMLTDRTLLNVFAAALLTVAVLHTVAFVWLRTRLLGVPIYEEQPAVIPLIEQEADAPEG